MDPAPIDAALHKRNLAARIGPTLVAMVQLAVTAASEDDVAALLLTRDRMDAAIAAMDSVARAAAYRAVISRLAAATGNSFYQLAAAQLLAETNDIVDALTAIDLKIYTADSEGGELRRMLEAIAARDAHLAMQAAQDHALIIMHRLDSVYISACGSAPALPDPGLPASAETSARPSATSSSGSTANASSAARE